jgi:hypothetical protein
MTARVTLVSASLTLAIGSMACGGAQGRPGHVLDEAMRAQRSSDSLKAADEDYFHDMDGGPPLTRAQIEGRNTWIVWTGGNDRFWDTIAVSSAGTLDLLKTISSHPTLYYGRRNRWDYLGLVNEPCFTQATGPDPNRYGLWLDGRDPRCPPAPFTNAPDPFANAEKYPGIKLGSRGTACACSRTRRLTSPPGRSGIPSGTIATRRTTFPIRS